MHFDVLNLPYIHRQVDFDRRFFPFLEFMVLRMITFYGLQATQMNEKTPRKLFVDLTLTQHPHDEDLEPQKVCFCFKVNPFELGVITFLQTFVPW